MNRICGVNFKLYFIFIIMKFFLYEKWTWVEVQASGSFSFRNNKHVGFLDKSNRLHPLRVFNLKQPGTELKNSSWHLITQIGFHLVTIFVETDLKHLSRQLEYQKYKFTISPFQNLTVTNENLNLYIYVTHTLI